ncbi:DUF1905 domain-containing protein [Rhizobium halophytocola]|uniref:DUF1905 domain-containing protein n=1 Tax=Rhizobium halophytocola TaxID=735519 RepID=A0ABS4DZJ9_9HYPH|nr:DUF1905 domain-containing protein [Rhizobium halophytocola]MBP1851112.1 hypothetical protein [Rhizobium halophytocola]
MKTWAFEAELWEYSGKGSWHFVTVPPDIGFQIRSESAGGLPGFGQVAVDATIGDTRFHTSLFPDRASGSYLLPVKAAVRKAERLSAGTSVGVLLGLR